MDTILLIEQLKDQVNKLQNELNELKGKGTEEPKVNDKEINEIMKENIDEVIENTNEKPAKAGIKLVETSEPKKKRGRKPKEDEVKPKHINKTYSYYKNSYTDEQREKCKERSRQRYYRIKALKGEGLKKDNKEPIKKRGRPPKSNK